MLTDVRSVGRNIYQDALSEISIIPQSNNAQYVISGVSFCMRYVAHCKH